MKKKVKKSKKINEKLLPKSLNGRPPLFKTNNELEEAIQSYFDWCFELKWIDEPARDEEWNKLYFRDKLKYTPVRKKVMVKIPTVSWLAVHLNTSRQTLINYEEKEKFFDTIKNAKQFIESIVEEWMIWGTLNSVGCIFNLKNNWWWKDKTETDITSNWKEIITINLPTINKQDEESNID